jgi:predicted dehydrogenase
MRLALLGIDDATLAIAAEAQRARKGKVVMIDVGAARASEASALARDAKLVGNWEDVLDAGAVDAVLVASDDPERRVAQLRRLVQLQLPTLVSHPVCLSMLDAYEIDMIHRESRGVLVPWLPARMHLAVAELWDLIEAAEQSPVGRVEQVLLERFMPQRDRDSVRRQFAIDADLLQYLAGDATKIHALGSTTSESTARAYGNLNVQMTCGDGLVCRWSVAPIEDRQQGRLTLVGSRGKAILTIPERLSETWRLETRIAGNSNQREFSNWDPAALAVDRLSAAVAGEPFEPPWTEASRTIELADTIDRSLAKGRTIDLHHEEFSDISTFKGTMASVGCGLLMLGLMLIVVVAIVHTIAVNAGWVRIANVLGNWPYMLLFVLGVFLLLQLLLLIGKPKERNQGAGVRSQESDRES